MKKITLFVAALFATTMAFAGTITIDESEVTWGTSYAKCPSTFTVSGQTFDVVNLVKGKLNAQTDSCLQFAKEDTEKSRAAGYIANKTELALVSIVLTKYGDYQNLTVYAGATVEGLAKVDLVESGSTYTATMPEGAKFFKIINESKYAAYCASIEINVEGEIDTEDGGDDSGDDSGDDDSETNYSFEPTEKTAIDETMTNADWTDYTSYGYVSVYMENDEFSADLYVVTENAEMPVGEFEINDTNNENTVVASIGGDDTYDYPSYVAAEYDDEGYYNAAYYLVSGTLKIEQDGENYNITLNAVSYNGSTVKMTYTGAVDQYTAIRDVEVMSDVYARDGRIYAEEGARIYTILGLDVTTMNGQLNGVYVVKNGNKVAKVVVK